MSAITTEVVVAACFIAIALFGVIDAIRTPLIVKRMYRDKGFTNHGKVELNSITAARIADGMYTEHHHQLAQSDSQPGIAQFKAWSNDRRKFTLSKATRKRNQAAWSVTVVEGDYSGLTSLVLPTVVPEAIGYIGNGQDIDLSHDEKIANRYHVTTGVPEVIRSLLVGSVRDFLLRADVIFMELTDTQLVIRRGWNAHQVIERLELELAIAYEMNQMLKERTA